MTITLSHTQKLSLDMVLAVSRGHDRVALAEETAAMLDERRAQILEFIEETKKPAYGFNRGFGHNVKDPVPPDAAKALQENLILSHACAVGEPVPVPIVRGAMLLRAQSLALGHSGVRAEVVRKIVDLLNADITPVVPRYGSVSASGDLAQLSHIALGLIGRGDVEVGGRRIPAADALREAGITPLSLEPKEGLALNNGVQYTASLGIHCVAGLDILLKTACVATALSTQVMLGADTPFRPDVHELRPHPGAQRAARWIFAQMAGSPMREAHRPYDIDGEIQDPYNIRCAPQVLGACLDLLQRARETLEIEINSVTDNPLILEAGELGGWHDRENGRYLGRFVEIVSGGHFHGMPLAVDLYGLIQAMAIAARLSNMRCARFVDEARNKGLGSELNWPGPAQDADTRVRQATSSGLMMPEYVSASLTNWIWGAAMPSHLFSLSTDAGQEDHVSMAANVALRVWDLLPRMADALAMELACGAQAAAIRKVMDHIPSRVYEPDGSVRQQRHPWNPEKRRLSPAGEAVLKAVADVFPTVTADRMMAAEIASLSGQVLSGGILRAAEQIAPLD